jgi:segregation and condensation protein B
MGDMAENVVERAVDNAPVNAPLNAAAPDGPANGLKAETAEPGDPAEREIDLDHLDKAAVEETFIEGAAVGGPLQGSPSYLEQRRAIEAVLMVAESPVEPTMLAQLLELSPTTVDQICDDLARSYRDDRRGFELARVAGGYRFQSHPDMAPYIERFVLEGHSARLSAAALESLAIVAYKQPISRAQVAAIRGVNSDGVLRTLCIRGYVTEVARDPGPGQALLYGTTTLLLERLGLDKIEDLPPLGDFVPGPEVMDALEQGLRPS